MDELVTIIILFRSLHSYTGNYISTIILSLGKVKVNILPNIPP